MPLPSWPLRCLRHHRPQHLCHLIASHLCSVSMALFSASSSPIYHLAPSVLNVIATSVVSYFLFWSTPRLCPRPFIFCHVLYTTSLSTLDHRHYADDTQLFFSFHTLNSDSSMSYLLNWLTDYLFASEIHIIQVVSWLITRFKNRVPGCWNRVTRIWLIGLGLDTKYLVKYNQKGFVGLTK